MWLVLMQLSRVAGLLLVIVDYWPESVWPNVCYWLEVVQELLLWSSLGITL
jgi:hypothetical protein